MSPPSKGQSRIIRAAEFGAIRDAAALVEAARRTAAQEEARAAQTRDDAREEGFREGYAEGLRGAAERFAAAAAETQKGLFDLESRIVPIVLRAVEDIVGSLGDEELCRRLVTRAIAATGEAGPVVLRVAAGEETLVREALASTNSSIEVVADRFLAEGEMVVESTAGRRHVGAREQLDALREAAGHG
ncbi:type III secretion system stator protein SctL [Rhizobium sp. TRM95111]|uniref:type III secretion system stator protein SctL n=1 Tax=Rhizobium alarense TaxID=2846851 RepID=UPI001F1F11FE|nr:type III secretion system stator protein SctL [Rhizobium alarense]MCF3641597.1 type III secretion system stator protein SctL [Rhizobium alarense]